MGNSRLAVSFRAICWPGSAFIFSRGFKLAHIYIQVTSLHRGEGLESISRFISNLFKRNSISRNTTHLHSYNSQSNLISIWIMQKNPMPVNQFMRNLTFCIRYSHHSARLQRVAAMGVEGQESVGTAFPHFFHSNLAWRCVHLLRSLVCSSRICINE